MCFRELNLEKYDGMEFLFYFVLDLNFTKNNVLYMVNIITGYTHIRNVVYILEI